MWRSNKVIVLVNVGQVEVVDFKFFFSSKINNHKDGDSAYVVAGRKLSSEEPVTVLEKGRFHTFSERSSISLAHFNNNNNKNNNKKKTMDNSLCTCHCLPAASILILWQLSVGETMILYVNLFLRHHMIWLLYFWTSTSHVYIIVIRNL